MRFQKIVEQLHVQLIVFHDQNAFLHCKNSAPRGGRSHGRFRKRKVMIIEFQWPWREFNRYGTINTTDMCKTKSTKFTVSVNAAIKKFDLADIYQPAFDERASA